MNSYPGYHYPRRKQSVIHGNHHGRPSRHADDRSSLIYALVSLASVYFLLYSFGISPYFFPRLAWKIIVYSTPSRLVAALDKDRTKNNPASGEAHPAYRNLYEKSQAMQRIIGHGANSIIPLLPRSRAYSSLSSVLLGSNDVYPAGLGNWDNSCYQNSIIQGLASLRSLREFLGANIQNLGHRHPLSTHIALRVIIDKLNDPENAGQKLWLPAELKSMCSWQQQDAQEYFSIIADQVDKEIRGASKGVTSDIGLKIARDTGRRAEVTLPSPPLTPGDQTTSDEPDTDRSIVPYCSPLEGLLAQRVGCMECGWTDGLSLIPFNCLTVTLGNKWEYDIRDCLDDYTSLETIEGVECAKCTLLRTQAQLEQLLSKIDPVEGSEETDSAKLNEALRRNAESRLNAVLESLQNDDFSEKTLKEKCHITSRNHVSSTKSKQAVIARPPKSLIIHVNRSVFDEMTGTLRKNYADVRFPKCLELDEWCLGTMPTDSSSKEEIVETWGINPSESMLPRPDSEINGFDRRYELQAVVTHHGRHENGHYICYRKYPVESFPIEVPQSIVEADGIKEKKEHWFRLSDEDVSLVSERSVLGQGGVFMLCYELVEPSPEIHRSISQAVPGRETQSISESQVAEDGIPLEEVLHKPESSAESPVVEPDWSRNTDSISSQNSSFSEDSSQSSIITNEELTTTNKPQQLATPMKTSNGPNIDSHENPSASSVPRLIKAL
ncbi:hypothetical protein MGYG_07662 [Nannizzia gypsea CBS 118893]|uniref:ubiquitinyl hydrolase 1 n=1 Tax=Arthroderma gypseum (strain ATCC MYA-4604 / CBS 118893) TaxID=535722 RepID=E4V3T3_ARTGP|nr:hypothetical protein MGYG_07662 [Nannizzia gypsea CBS 118893]EFR04657.1 hypothetical protein MGYG_07662 [Nannizzia gypsea CBS 118893]